MDIHSSRFSRAIGYDCATAPLLPFHTHQKRNSPQTHIRKEANLSSAIGFPPFFGVATPDLVLYDTRYGYFLAAGGGEPVLEDPCSNRTTSHNCSRLPFTLLGDSAGKEGMGSTGYRTLGMSCSVGLGSGHLRDPIGLVLELGVEDSLVQLK